MEVRPNAIKLSERRDEFGKWQLAKSTQALRTALEKSHNGFLCLKHNDNFGDIATLLLRMWQIELVTDGI